MSDAVERHIRLLREWLAAHPEKPGETADQQRARADREAALRRWLELRDHLARGNIIW